MWFSSKTILVLGLLPFSQVAATTIIDQIVLPAAGTDAAIALTLPQHLPTNARLKALPLLDADGFVISPQPDIKLTVKPQPAADGDLLTLSLSNVNFWGQAKLRVTSSPSLGWNLILRRGPLVTSDANATANDHSSPGPHQVTVSDSGRAALWVYNFGSEALKLKWRILSEGSVACDASMTGALQTCGTAAVWHELLVEPVHSEPLWFGIPRSWFNPLAGGAVRDSYLDMRFGDGENAPTMRINLRLVSEFSWWRRAVLFLPPWVADVFPLFGRLLWTLTWTTLGAVFLMLAQVMIPNFRKILKMEGQIEALEERLRAINSRVGDRLHTRCKRELQTVRFGLFMGDIGSKAGGFHHRLALTGNAAEVDRLSGVLARIEARVRLTERLDERLTEVVDFDTSHMPPTLVWRWQQEVKNVQSILARQFINDSDEKAAAASLDLIGNTNASLGTFSNDLNHRIQGLKRQFGKECQGQLSELVKLMNPCVDILTQEDGPTVGADASMSELVLTDIAVYRAEVLVELVALEPLLSHLSDGRETKERILQLLRSTDPSQLAEARLELTIASQGVRTDAIESALKEGMWDIYSEPTTVLPLDVVSASLTFRQKALNLAAARGKFKCFWAVKRADTDGAPSAIECYEPGWDIQVIAKPGRTEYVPEVYTEQGKQIGLGEGGPEHLRALVIDSETSQGTTFVDRGLRGLLDAAITAVVPVLTVAITQFQHSAEGDGFANLILLGFTSQAIRSVIIPDTTGVK